MAAAAVIASAGAAVLSPEQAIQRARGNSPARARGVNATEMKLVHTASTAKGEAAAYVFAFEGDHGYTILSANDIAVPVLGYSNSGTIDTENMPAALKWWLSQYAAQIEFAENAGVRIDDNTRYRAPETMAAIEPLVKTRWDQGEPYNGLCPKQGNAVCPTGCVATSMSQVMNYFKYPERAEGTIQYRWNGQTLRMDFSEEAFDWENMLATYAKGDYTETQAHAVAYLMKACGYAVEMDYSPYMSGAISANIINAMKDHFKYDKNVRYVSRDIYSYDQWVKICYDNLRNCGPIIYNGTDPIAGGHSFVVDGYDGNGYFHLNWGWSGMSDGYYSLDALTPVAQGTGGAMGGFNYSQDAVIGLKKPDGSPEQQQPLSLFQYGACVGSLSGMTLSLTTTGGLHDGWANLNSDNMIFSFGVIIQSENGGDPVTAYAKFGNTVGTQRLQPNQLLSSSYNRCPNVTLPDLADGRYTVTLASEELRMEGFTPVQTSYGYANYVVVNVANGEYTVENIAPELLKFESVQLTSPLYRNRNVRLKARISNPYDKQLTACITPQLKKNDATQYVGETILVTVDAKTDLDYEWVTKFYESNDADAFEDPSTYTLTIYNQDAGTSYGEFGDVQMTTTSNSFSLRSDELSIQGAKVESMTIAGQDYSKVYVVEDPLKFDVDFTYTVSRGYFDTTIMMGIFRRAVNSTSFIPVTDYVWESTPFLGTDETETVRIPVTFKDAQPDAAYYMRVEYIRNGSPTYLSQIVFTMPNASAVDMVVNDQMNAPVEYYNLQGVRVAEPQEGQLLIRRQGARSEKIVF